MASTGRPFDAAISSETTFEPATWILPLTSEGTVVAPPCEGCRLIFRPCLSKKPFEMPKATNAEGTPAVSWTLSVVGPSEPPPEPGGTVGAVARAAASSAAACRDRHGERCERERRNRPRPGGRRLHGSAPSCVKNGS